MPTTTDETLVSLSVLKGLGLMWLLILKALEVARACGHIDCDWASGIFAMEFCSGMFFMMNGIVMARSVCNRLSTGRGRASAIFWRQLGQSIALILLGTLSEAIERAVGQLLQLVGHDLTGAPQGLGDIARRLRVGPRG